MCVIYIIYFEQPVFTTTSVLETAQRFGKLKLNSLSSVLGLPIFIFNEWQPLGVSQYIIINKK